MAYEYENLEYANQENIGGIPVRLYYAEHADISSFLALPAFTAITTPASAATLTGSLVMKAGKVINYLDCTISKGAITAKGVGEIGGRSTKTELKFMVDGVTETIAGLKRLFANGRYIFLVPNLNKANNYQVIGWDQNFPAQLKDDELASGEGPEGKRGATFTFESNDKTLAFATITAEQLSVLLTDEGSGA